MPKICYVPKRFQGKSHDLVRKANQIIEEYDQQGFTLTLRQLYYQFVARDFIPNNMKSYKRLGDVINDARLAGLIDWDAIEDRTRNIRALPHWNDPADIVDTCAKQFNLDLWATQKYRVEVWIEKDALIGVIERVCTEFDVQYFSCRGYVSQSEMWAAAMRTVNRMSARHNKFPQRTVVLHLGDHDPSGLDMTRDISDRINLFAEHHGCRGAFEMRRLALNMDQVEEHNPPPNPAKVTDARFVKYQEQHGDESWELDALEPTLLDGLIRNEVATIVDRPRFDALKAQQMQHRAELASVAKRWPNVVSAIEDGVIKDVSDYGDDEDDEV